MSVSPEHTDTPLALGAPATEASERVAKSPHDGTVSLGELVAEASLHVDVLIEPTDAGRAIRYVYPTELADPSPYLRGEELVLSVGVPITGQPTPVIERYISNLKNHGVAALLVGLGDLFTEPPDALLAACRKHDLPLLAQRAAVPFRRIVDWVDAQRAADRAVDSREHDLARCCAGSSPGHSGSAPSNRNWLRAGWQVCLWRSAPSPLTATGRSID